MNVLHLTPTFANRYGAGHWKACQALDLSLRELGLTTRNSVFNADDGSGWGALLSGIDDSVRNVIVEYSWTPDLVAAIRLHCPKARIHVRAHNPEAWQHLHRSGGVLALARPKTVYGVFRLLTRDSRCRQTSDTVLSISEWDSRHYWSRLPGRAPIVDVPYFSPWPWLRPGVKPRPWRDRENLVLSLPGARDPIGHAAATGFYELARRLSPLLSGWCFGLTAGVFRPPRDAPPPSGITAITDLEEPWDLLCRAKAIAVLTPLGFGAKTTVFDALAAGCHVLVHPKVAARLPSTARRRCIVVDFASACDYVELAEEVRSEALPNEVNSALQAQAADNLRAAMTATDVGL